MLFNFAFFLAAGLLLAILRGQHLLDLRLSQVVLLFLVNVLLATLDVQVVSCVFNNHLFGFDGIGGLTLLNHLHVFPQLLKVVLVHDLLQLLFWERELLRILFVFLLQVRQQQLLFTIVQLI